MKIEKCPSCGMDFIGIDDEGSDVFKCDSFKNSGKFYQSNVCFLNGKLTELKAKHERLKEAAVIAISEMEILYDNECSKCKLTKCNGCDIRKDRRPILYQLRKAVEG